MIMFEISNESLSQSQARAVTSAETNVLYNRGNKMI